MPDNAIAIKYENKTGQKVFVFEDYVAGALTAAATKKEWVVPFYARIVDVVVDSEGAGVGTANTIIDVNRNGTTIYTTQNNRPTLRSNDTGDYKWTADGLSDRLKPDITRLVPGDILSYDVDQIQATSGNTRTLVAIILEPV